MQQGRRAPPRRRRPRLSPIRPFRSARRGGSEALSITVLLASVVVIPRGSEASRLAGRVWPRTGASALMLLVLIGVFTGCGDDGAGGVDRTAPERSSIPAVDGRSLEQLAREEAGEFSQEIVASPAGRVFRPGDNRFGFGMFTVSREQIDDAEVAVYAAAGPDGRLRGPYPARRESLATAGAFTSKTASGDPDAITRIYVADLELPTRGEWRLLALVREGDSLIAARMPSIEVRSYSRIPRPGDKAPVVHTPTVDDVGDITSIETRIPPDTMHDVDFADALGKQPVVLVFGTPALCQSRVCGPVVDVTEQVKNKFDPDEIAFIHMEVFRDNKIDSGLRPQLRAFGLPTEPWLFVIDREGRVSTAIEGGFSVDEVEEAVAKVVR